MSIGDTVEVELGDGIWRRARLINTATFGAGTWQDGVTVSTDHYHVMLATGQRETVGKHNIRKPVGIQQALQAENEQLKLQLELMTAERNTWELHAHGSIEAIERIAATLDIDTQEIPGGALGKDYLTLEKAIIEYLEDIAK